VDSKPELIVEAAPTVVANIASVDGRPHVFLANFTGLVPRKIAVPSVQTKRKDIGAGGKGKDIAVFLPFLGEVQTVRGQHVGDRLVFTVPTARTRRSCVDRGRGRDALSGN